MSNGGNEARQEHGSIGARDAFEALARVVGHRCGTADLQTDAGCEDWWTARARLLKTLRSGGRPQDDDLVAVAFAGRSRDQIDRLRRLDDPWSALTRVGALRAIGAILGESWDDSEAKTLIGRRRAAVGRRYEIWSIDRGRFVAWCEQIAEMAGADEVYRTAVAFLEATGEAEKAARSRRKRGSPIDDVERRPARRRLSIAVAVGLAGVIGALVALPGRRGLYDVRVDGPRLVGLDGAGRTAFAFGASGRVSDKALWPSRPPYRRVALAVRSRGPQGDHAVVLDGSGKMLWHGGWPGERAYASEDRSGPPIFRPGHPGERQIFFTSHSAGGRDLLALVLSDPYFYPTALTVVDVAQGEDVGHWWNPGYIDDLHWVDTPQGPRLLVAGKNNHFRRTHGGEQNTSYPFVARLDPLALAGEAPPDLGDAARGRQDFYLALSEAPFGVLLEVAPTGVVTVKVDADGGANESVPRPPCAIAWMLGLDGSVLGYGPLGQKPVCDANRVYFSRDEPRAEPKKHAPWDPGPPAIVATALRSRELEVRTNRVTWTHDPRTAMLGHASDERYVVLASGKPGTTALLAADGSTRWTRSAQPDSACPPEFDCKKQPAFEVRAIAATAGGQIPALLHARGRAVAEVLTASCAGESPCVVRLLHVTDGHTLREVWTANRALGAAALPPDGTHGSLLVIAIDERHGERVVAIDLDAAREDLAGRAGGHVIAAASIRRSDSFQVRRAPDGVRVASSSGEVTLEPATAADRRAVVPACLGALCAAGPHQAATP